MEKFKKEMALKACERELGVSKAVPGKWISKISGRLIDMPEAMDILAHRVVSHYGIYTDRCIDIDFDNSAQDMAEALEGLGTVTELDVYTITTYNHAWKFFNGYFKPNSGVKILLSDIHTQFKANVKQIAIREFYAELNQWLIETGQDYKFINRKVNRKIVIY